MDEVSEKLKVQGGIIHGLQNPLNIFMALLQLARIKIRICNNDNSASLCKTFTLFRSMKFQALSTGLNNERRIDILWELSFNFYQAI